jgi:hypothetical protein
MAPTAPGVAGAEVEMAASMEVDAGMEEASAAATGTASSARVNSA